MKDVSLILYSVPDLAKAKRFFSELSGVEPYVDSAQYVGYKNGGIEVGLTPSRDVVQKVRDVGYGMLVASVKEPNGSIVGLRQPPKG